MKKTFCIRLKVASLDADEISNQIWNEKGILGIQECQEDGSGLFKADKAFEILEFGTEAAQKCSEWLERDRYRKGATLVLDVHREASHLKEAKLFFQSLEGVELISVQELKPKDYLEEYKKGVQGQCVGKTLWVGPPWDKVPPKRNIIYVEPALAFGTGEHPTTQLCLERIEELSSEISPKRILDLGTGSGVLSAASRLFFPHAEISALDIDSLSEESFKKTFELNRLSFEKLRLLTGTQADIKSKGLRQELGKYELIISNIYAEVLAGLSLEISELMAPRAKWLLSGVLEGACEKILLSKISEDFLCKVRRSRVKTQGPDSQESESWLMMELEKKNDS